MKRCSVRVSFVVGFLLLGANPVSAEEGVLGRESEREVLARIVLELHLIEDLVAKADQRKPTQARITFDYAQLVFELNTVRDGIAAYLKGPRLQPRSFAPLNAEYTQVNSQAAQGHE